MTKTNAIPMVEQREGMGTSVTFVAPGSPGRIPDDRFC
jgi:hypothetical protein